MIKENSNTIKPIPPSLQSKRHRQGEVVYGT